VGVGVGFSLGSGWKAADRELIRASVATLVFPTESPLNWVCARWPEGSLFGHWRSGVAFAQVSCRSTRRGVREHPAPSGALRLWRNDRTTAIATGQGAPSTIRCIKTAFRLSPVGADHFHPHPHPEQTRGVLDGDQVSPRVPHTLPPVKDPDLTPVSTDRHGTTPNERPCHRARRPDATAHPAPGPPRNAPLCEQRADSRTCPPPS